MLVQGCNIHERAQRRWICMFEFRILKERGYGKQEEGSSTLARIHDGEVAPPTVGTRCWASVG
uniref:Uncharacterized protein n=1 Tax=Triticum urartu TaxID=4572 RepID=A0A8R7PXZ2_TRIUA